MPKLKQNWKFDRDLAGNGLFFDLAHHQLDIIGLIAGRPKEIGGFSINHSKKHEVDDVFSRTVVYEKEVLFNGLWNFSSPVDAEKDICEVIGTKGKMTFGFFKNLTLRVKAKGIQKEKSFTLPKHVQQPLIEQVVNYFRDQSITNPCSPADALEGMKIMEGTLTAKR